MTKNPTSDIPHPDGKTVHTIDHTLAARVAEMDKPAADTSPSSVPDPADRDAIIAQGDEARLVADEHVDAALADVAASDEAKDERKAALTSLPADIMPKPVP
jgi:hypothetical protein